MFLRDHSLVSGHAGQLCLQMKPCTFLIAPSNARKPTNLKDLWKVCQEEWQKIEKDYCAKLLVNYASKRLEGVLKNKGYHIPYQSRYTVRNGKKKYQPRNWFGEQGTSRGSEQHQIDPKLLRRSLLLIQEQFGIIQNLPMSHI